MKQYCALIALVMLATPANAAEWVRVETPNFVVFGQTGERRTKEVAAEFERFREAIGQVLSTAAVASAVPTTVVVFESHRAFAPYRPTYNGKPVMVGGYFMGSESDAMIALTVDDRDSALRIIFHEYTHLITSNSSRVLPAWVNEGFSDRGVQVFRRLNPGEQRTEGALERIDCAQNGRVTLVVRADGELKRFAVAAFSDIDFISYRDERTGSINCGDRKPADLVYVTWVPVTPISPGITGKPVAVEFLPGK